MEVSIYTNATVQRPSLLNHNSVNIEAVAELVPVALLVTIANGLVLVLFKKNTKLRTASNYVRVVTRYMGSGIKGLKKGGIRDHSLGSGIKALGIKISVFSMGSRIRRLDNNNNLRCAPKHGFLKLFEIL